MSLHAISPQALEAMKRQRKAAVVSGAVISFLVIGLIMILLSLFLLQPMYKEVPTIVTYVAESQPEEKPEPKITNPVEKPPSAPAASLTKVITSSAPSPVSVPTPESDVEVPSVDFGLDGDFGDGYGTWGDGGGGGASFFQQKVKGNRIAYVIDYSGSMSQQNRLALMKAELIKSISALPPTIQYQMIFFSGPAWVAGGLPQVSNNGNNSTASIEYDQKVYEWKGRGAHEWEPVSRAMPRTEWMSATSNNIKESLKAVKQTKITWGTDWEPAIEMALGMSPAPQIIFFMTDGQAGPQSMEKAERLAELAKFKNVTVNTIALMEPKAEKAMSLLAKETGGQFTLIDANGKASNP